jgi:Zn-dependent protease
VPIGGFGLLSLFYAVLGVRFAMQFWPARKAIFDNQITHHDRSMIAQAAFFFLLPVSVLLHEFGHALAIWIFGGEVVDFGFYFFAGFVSYDPTGFSDVQQMLIAFAGTLMNIVLIALAMGVVLLKSPPLRPAYNELLLQFSVVSGLNALIVYPALDYASGLSGDWTQMYDGGVPWLTAVIIAIQAGVIALGVWMSRSSSMRARLAKRTGVRRPEDRGLLSWNAASRQPPAGTSDAMALNDAETRLSNAASRVVSGWNAPVNGRLMRIPDGSTLTLQWDSRGAPRIVMLRADNQQQVTIIGGAISGDGASQPASTRKSWPRLPSEDELTIALRLAMEEIDREAQG